MDSKKILAKISLVFLIISIFWLVFLAAKFMSVNKSKNQISYIVDINVPLDNF